MGRGRKGSHRSCLVWPTRYYYFLRSQEREGRGDFREEPTFWHLKVRQRAIVQRLVCTKKKKRSVDFNLPSGGDARSPFCSKVELKHNVCAPKSLVLFFFLPIYSGVISKAVSRGTSRIEKQVLNSMFFLVSLPSLSFFSFELAC